MPLTPFASLLMAHARKVHHAKGRALFIGRLWPQTTSFAQLREALAEYRDIPLPDLPDNHVVDDTELCEWLGFEGCDSMDFNDSEGAGLVHDMNLTPPPTRTHGKYGMVFDFGTMEHVFHIPNFLKNVFFMLEEGGTILHSIPTNMMVEHGFYQCSPTLFFDYYTTNKFKVLDCMFTRRYTNEAGETTRYEVIPFNTYEHAPDPLNNKMGEAITSVVFLARKTLDSSCDKIPIQFRYRR